MKERNSTVKENKFTKEGNSQVAAVPHFNGDYLPTSVQKATDLLGGIE